MNLTKNEFIELLEQLKIPMNEGESSFANSAKYPRVVFWDYLWEDKVASEENFVTIETYQVSFFSKTPRHPKLLELRQLLRDKKLYPVIQHEYIEDKGKDIKYYHSFFSLELTVDE